MSSEPALSVCGLSKVYQLYARPLDRLKQMFFGKNNCYFSEVCALREVSFSVAAGESVGVLGINGSGKSTLLQLLCGTLQPSQGTVVSKGRISTLLELGAGFNPEFTGRENVFLSARILGMDEEEIKRRYPAIVAFADIGEFIDRPVRCYSSGMYVRLAFAVAAHTDPDILLVDEVLAVGDVFFQQKCNLHMQRALSRAAKVIVTHSLNTVANMTSRVLVLDNGRLVFDGPPLEAIEAYTRLAYQTDPSLASPPQASSPKGGVVVSEPATPLQPIPTDKLSGELGAVFTDFAVAANGRPYQGCVIPGATVSLVAKLDVKREVKHPLVGYLFSDRYGNYLFGQNTITAGLPLAPLHPGVCQVCLSFTWPEIAPGDYFLTLGLGNGHEAMAHAIVCWAHNIFHFSAITPGKDIHGLFNGSLRNVSIRPVPCGAP